jgi:hypothetical protein
MARMRFALIAAAGLPVESRTLGPYQSSAHLTSPALAGLSGIYSGFWLYSLTLALRANQASAIRSNAQVVQVGVTDLRAFQ